MFGYEIETHAPVDINIDSEGRRLHNTDGTKPPAARARANSSETPPTPAPRPVDGAADGAAAGHPTAQPLQR